MSVSVGDFAENLLAQGAVEPLKEGSPSLEVNSSVFSAEVTAQAPDISAVEVPDNFVQSIIEEKTPEMPKRIEVAPPPQEISEVAELKTLIQEIKDLLLEVKGTLTEVTAAGSLGVNLAGPDATKTKEQENAEKMETFLNKIRKKKKATTR